MKRRLILMSICLCLCCCIWPLQMVAQSIQLNSMTTHELSHQWLFSFYLSGVTQYRTFTLKDPDRFILDLKNVQTKKHFGYKPLIGTPIKTVRFSAHNDNIFRVVFDLDMPVDVTLNQVSATAPGEYKLDVRFVKKPHTVAGFDWPAHAPAASNKPDLLREVPTTEDTYTKKKSEVNATSSS